MIPLYVKSKELCILAPHWGFSYLGIMQTIPTYPAETPLELGHLDIVQPFLLDNRHGVSEFSMASLYPFTKKRHYTISTYTQRDGKPGYLFRGLQQYGEKEEIFAMLPAGFPDKDLLADLFTCVSEINAISEDLKLNWEQGLSESNLDLSMEEDRDNADYIYLRKNLIELNGKDLHKKLVHAHHFVEDHPDRILIPSQIAKSSDMIAVLDKWAEGKDLVEDYKATLLAIECRNELGLKGVVLYTGNDPVAFTLGEEDGYSRFIIHVEKAVGGLRGVYQYINRAFATELPEKIIEINREQDLGIPGLRQAKKTYSPSRLLMKYKIRKTSTL
ncbi:DUF2156 domain-containing protein [Pleomorphochaeta sp. DL1XJH-081]|uniref:DUF2156 domain-containing protein n=1 Tax=Pleomorphochaeta sp. DL1XJH-081 TaxID=3409690 RepID=UPI003BB4FCD7